MKNSPSTPSPQSPSVERGSVVSTRRAILAMLLAFGIGRCGNNHDNKSVASENSDPQIVYLVAENECAIEEKNMSSADDGLGQFGCSGLSKKEVVELGKKLKHERGLAFRDSMVKKYELTDEDGIADLENAALRGYVKEVEMIFNGEIVMLKLADDYGNEEIVQFPKSGGSFPESDDCLEGGVDGIDRNDDEKGKTVII